MADAPSVGVVMGSKSDWEVMEHAVATLDRLEVPREVRVLSAHRTPDALESWLEDVTARGCQVFVAAAGGAAHLAGVVASKTLKPVLGVPMGTQLGGLDSLLSTVQMPAGIPVGTLAIGRAGSSRDRTPSSRTGCSAIGSSRRRPCSTWAIRARNRAGRRGPRPYACAATTLRTSSP
jgi:5-(carboxyamino)imidazole ribonucleotide mutase